MTDIVKISSATDSQILRCVVDVAETLGHPSQNLKVSLVGGLAQEFSLPDGIESLKEHPLYSENSRAIYRLTWAAPPLAVSYFRGGKDQNQTSAFQDEVSFTTNAGGSNQFELGQQEKIAILQALTKKLGGEVGAPGNASPISWNDLYHSYEQRVNRLEALHENLIRNVTEQGRKQQAEHEELSRRLVEEYGEKSKSLDDDFQRRKSEVDAKAEAVREREESLEAQDNRIFRRQVRASLIEELKQRAENFSLTKGTNRKRVPVNVALIVMFVTALLFSMFWATELSRMNLENASFLAAFPPIAKSFLSTALVFLIGFYGIGWQKKWHDSHADAEFRLKQFELDIERSSLVIEAALEWKGSETSGDMPEKLLEALTRNLFQVEERQESERRTAADDLASAILGSSASTKLKVGNADIELNRKGIKSLERSPGE